MGADIWLGPPGESLAYFRDSYTGAITLGAVADLSYWADLWPKLEGGEVFPLVYNEWLAEAIRAGIAERIDGPRALELAAAYCDMAQIPRGRLDLRIKEWRAHSMQLLAMIERSTALQMPLIMSL